VPEILFVSNSGFDVRRIVRQVRAEDPAAHAGGFAVPGERLAPGCGR
jgi:hypothetical protein